MSQLTQKAIIDSTLKLAEKKPINKITVHDIVVDCGITRNTFYYHYHDVYDVLEKAIAEHLTELTGNNKDDPEKVIFDLIDYAASHKKVWVNVYKAFGQERLSEYLSTTIRRMILYYFSTLDDISVFDDEDLDIITSFYEFALLGQLFRWVKQPGDGDAEELKNIVDRIRVLFVGQLPLMLQHCRRKK